MKIVGWFKELLIFGFKQIRASLFAGVFLFLLIISHYWQISFLPRADFLFVAAIFIQFIMVATKLETVDEAKTIALFHIIGLVLEIFKTSPQVGSWRYPELGFFHIADVPLYSGFMYASIGSYIAQAWKIMKLKLLNAPSYKLSLALAIAIYLNFFTNHFLPDARWLLALAVLILYWHTKVEFEVMSGVARKMPLTLSFVLIAVFVWAAENVGTFVNAWQYPYQVSTWSAVSLHKVSSWSLLVIISFLLIAYLKQVKAKRQVNL